MSRRFQWCIPRTAFLVFPSAGADPSGPKPLVVDAVGRYFTSSMMAVFSVSHLMLSRVRKNLVHRFRILACSTAGRRSRP